MTCRRVVHRGHQVGVPRSATHDDLLLMKDFSPTFRSTEHKRGHPVAVAVWGMTDVVPTAELVLGSEACDQPRWAHRRLPCC